MTSYDDGLPFRWDNPAHLPAWSGHDDVPDEDDSLHYDGGCEPGDEAPGIGDC